MAELHELPAAAARRIDAQVLDALDELVAALSDLQVQQSAARRAEAIRLGRRDGHPYHDLVTGEARPLLVELVSGHLDRIARAGAQLRRAEAAALHAEGMTMETIAEAFGVTRQRVSAILKDARADGLIVEDETG